MANGGKFGDDSNLITEIYLEEDIIILNWIDEPHREGYIFAGWELDGDIVSDITVTDDILLIATWVKEDDVIHW